MEPEEWPAAIAAAVKSLRDQAQRCRLVADRYGPQRGDPIYKLALDLERQAGALEQRAASLATDMGEK